MADGDANNLDWLRKKQFDEVSLQYRTVWDLYLKFYTVFLTFNITALGLTIQYISGINRLPIVVAFLLQNANALVTAMRIANFSRESASRMQRISKDILAAIPEPIPGNADEITESVISGELGYWGGLANAIEHGLLIACWTYVLFL